MLRNQKRFSDGDKIGLKLRKVTIHIIQGDITKVNFVAANVNAVEEHTDAFDEILWVLFSSEAKEIYDQELLKRKEA